jgi:hypothetical protein
MKNVICLEHHSFPWQLEQAIAAFIDHYNHHRYHESLDNLTRAGFFFRRAIQLPECPCRRYAPYPGPAPCPASAGAVVSLK